MSSESVISHIDERRVNAPTTLGELGAVIIELLARGQSPDSTWAIELPRGQTADHERELVVRWRIYTCEVAGCERDANRLVSDHHVCVDHDFADIECRAPADDGERLIVGGIVVGTDSKTGAAVTVGEIRQMHADAEREDAMRDRADAEPAFTIAERPPPASEATS